MPFLTQLVIKYNSVNLRKIFNFLKKPHAQLIFSTTYYINQFFRSTT